MEESRYNGWANYATWCVKRWLGNDEGLYRMALNLAHSATDIDALADSLRDILRDELNPLAGDASLYSDMLFSYFDNVNWHYTAEAVWKMAGRDEEEAEDETETAEVTQ